LQTLYHSRPTIKRVISNLSTAGTMQSWRLIWPPDERHTRADLIISRSIFSGYAVDLLVYHTAWQGNPQYKCEKRGVGICESEVTFDTSATWARVWFWPRLMPGNPIWLASHDSTFYRTLVSVEVATQPRQKSTLPGSGLWRRLHAFASKPYLIGLCSLPCLSVLPSFLVCLYCVSVSLLSLLFLVSTNDHMKNRER